MKKYLTEIIICLFIITTGGIIYAQIGSHDYILYDDMMSLYDPFVTEGLSLEKLGQVFYNLPDRLPYQVPIPAIVRLVLWELFGGNPGKHHLFSLYAHLSVALLLFLILRSATGKIFESGFCAILVTVHPINSEAVSWLAGYNGMLEAFFLMAALLCYYYYVKSPSMKRYLLVFIPFMLGLMCKPSLAVLPFLLLLLDYWPLQRFELKKADMKNMITNFFQNKIILEKLPFVVLVLFHVTVVKLIATGHLKHTDPALWTFHPESIVDFMVHLNKVVFPTGLAICRPDPHEASMWTAIGMTGILILISILILKKKDLPGYLVTGWFWFLITSAPVILMLVLSGRAVEDHHLYIPLMGIFIIITFGLSSFLSRFRYSRYVFPVTSIIVVTPLIVMAHIQTGHWKNSITIFNHALSIHPDNKKTHANLGDAYMDKNNILQAIHHYRKFLRISPENALGHTKLANALTLSGMTGEAARHYRKAITLSPNYVPAYHGLADLLVRIGSPDEAIALYRSALKLNPDLFQTHNNLALALYEQGNFQQAYGHLRQAIKINPDYQTAARNLRIILDSQAQSGKKDGLSEHSHPVTNP